MVGTVAVLAGRDAELARLRALGRDAALLVAGEAGSGKTALARAAADGLAAEAAVIWAACLPLAEVSAPLLSLRSALVDFCTPDTRFTAGPDATLAFDAWLAEVRGERRVLLVIDDLQWADPSSLDVLMYVLAGPVGRDVTVVATLRTGDGPDDPRLRRWLADARRLPRVEELPLGRLDRNGVRDQVAAALGGAPYESLVDDVFARTLGNPYLTSLLIRGLPPDATALPAERPAELRDAVSRTWLGLPPAARTATEFLAVAGHPQRVADLAAVGPGLPLEPALRAAVDAAVLRVDAAGRFWFTHPLLAEVLAGGLLPEERRTLHARFALALEAGADPERAVELADHHWLAGQREPAYRWALRAADAAEAGGGPGEAILLLRRAYEIHPDTGLLQRIRIMAARAGRDEDELAAVEDLLAGPSPALTPEEQAELLVQRMQLRHVTARTFMDEMDPLRAAQLLAGRPPGPAAALVQAELSRAEAWHGRPGALDRAYRAAALARAAGGGRPLAYALTAIAMAHNFLGGAPEAVDLARQGQQLAAACRDFHAFLYATLTLGIAIAYAPSDEVLAVHRAARRQAESLGAPRSYLARLASMEADLLLPRGDWRGCTKALRVALAAGAGQLYDTMTRLIAARLACLQGRTVESYAHLARAEELYAELAAAGNTEYDAVRAEVAAAAGDTDAAVGAALAGLHANLAPAGAERLLPTAARALADRAGRLRDRGLDPGDALNELDELRARYPVVRGEDGGGPEYAAVRQAMQVVYDTECARAHAADPQWTDAGDACQVAGLPWEEAYCRWRLAEAAATRRPARQATRDAVHRAYGLASDLQAVPLMTELETLAASARIPLRFAAEPVPAQRGLTDRLTAREREVLGHLVAGRTYAEIAAVLVLSEKTVSVHVSNMLRKTGSANRVELIRRAGRTIIARTRPA